MRVVVEEEPVESALVWKAEAESASLDAASGDELGQLVHMLVGVTLHQHAGDAGHAGDGERAG